MNTAAPSIRPALPNDLPEALALIRLIQPHLKRSLEWLNWQYFESPGNNSNLLLARDYRTQQLIATYGAVSQFLQVGNDRVPAWMIQDVMTHPDHRGQGHLHGLAQFCLEKMRNDGIAGYTLPNGQSQRSFLRTGWTRADLVPSRELDISNRSFRDISLDPFGPCGFAEVEGVWANSGLGLSVVRDAAFLSWRYRKPHESYALFSDHREYFVALKLFDSTGGRILHILDLFTSEKARDRVEELLHACLAVGSRCSAVRATAWLPADHPYAERFESVGLCLKQSPERFLYVELPSRISIASPWHFTQGDSDVY